MLCYCEVLCSVTLLLIRSINQLRLKGYVHDVSPSIKKSRAKSFPYFNFSLQVDAGMKRQAVCYDTSKHKILKGYEDSREPIALDNITEKRSLRDASATDVIVNKRSRIERANNNDIGFELRGSPATYPTTHYY